MNRPLLVCVGLLVLAGTALAKVAKGEDSLKKLASIEDFAFGGIGIAGTPSPGELAFRGVLESSTASGDFLKLLKTGNLQAKCYALVALRVLSPQIYAARIGEYRKDKTEVHTASGCMMAVFPMASVVGTIETGSYDRYVKKGK